MADPPAIERGPTGDPANPSLPQGEATQLAQEQQAVKDAQQPKQGQQAPSPQLPPDAFSVPTPPPAGPQATSDEERYLLSPPRQGEPVTAPAPTSAGGGLGLLDEAAQDPSAPPQVAMLRNLIADSIGR